MPYPNEHAARQHDPSKYKDFRRSTLKLPKGISAIIGILPNGKTEIQALRFDRKLWTPSQAKKWLREHNFKTNLETATNKNVSWNGII